MATFRHARVLPFSGIVWVLIDNVIVHFREWRHWFGMRRLEPLRRDKAKPCGRYHSTSCYRILKPRISVSALGTALPSRTWATTTIPTISYWCGNV